MMYVCRDPTGSAPILVTRSDRIKMRQLRILIRKSPWFDFSTASECAGYFSILGFAESDVPVIFRAPITGRERLAVTFLLFGAENNTRFAQRCWLTRGTWFPPYSPSSSNLSHPSRAARANP